MPSSSLPRRPVGPTLSPNIHRRIPISRSNGCSSQSISYLGKGLQRALHHPIPEDQNQRSRTFGKENDRLAQSPTTPTTGANRTTTTADSRPLRLTRSRTSGGDHSSYTVTNLDPFSFLSISPLSPLLSFPPLSLHSSKVSSKQILNPKPKDFYTMAPVLGLFSSSKSGTACELEEGTAATGEAKPKARRGARPPAPKKPPQRGLGVAQLERLRLQERWKMVSDTMESTVSFPIYDLPAMSRFGGAWVDAHPLPPKAAASQPQTFPALVYLPHCRSGIQIPGGGYGTFPASRPAMHEHYALDRFQFGAGNPVLEPPSNQTSPLCFSNQCEFCVRKKRLFGGNPALSSDGDLLEMNLASSLITDEAKISGEYRSSRPFKSARETELKEFDFFPRNLAFTADEQSEFAGASSAGDGCSPSFIDLSLTL